MIQHQILEEKVKAVLAKAGLPIASTYDASLSVGAFLEVADDEKLPPEVFLKWRVHSTLHAHFRSVQHDRLEGDPLVMEMVNAEQAMNVAIASILKFSGFNVRMARGERVGEMVISEP
ncbi:hypothetical protein ACIQVK_14565 [Streptomyces sp. NPDC090493]|uniref:hypothetical protein n=1 Tax=Streptomyces sp. NPDC090493 TaxID=3365964 RepID=UPI00382B460C